MLLSLLSRIQILEGIASRDRLERVAAEGFQEVSEESREATEQRLAVAFSQINDVARIAGEVNASVAIMRDYIERDQEGHASDTSGNVRREARRALNGSAGLSRIKPRF